ncbi:MAG: ExbD/TolR family protein [Opitutales bacterium]
MARSFHRPNRLAAVTEINVTPLIDLAFALLIIFIITTPLLEQTIEVDLPVETQNPQSAGREPKTQTISIDGEGQVYWGDEAVSAENLGRLLDDLARQPNPPVLNIRGDAAVPYQAVISVIDEVKQRKLSRISLDTRVQ